MPVPSRPQLRGTRPVRWSDWSQMPDAELLQVRLCDLDLQWRGSVLEQRMQKLQAELDSKGLRFRPYAWLSTDWFTPDDATGFAVPFYLAHPRLLRLERRHMLEVEGTGGISCMKIMRHETGHALDNAFGLRRRRRWRECFGRSSAPYRDSYTPDPNSREFVQNLDGWYAQSHPLEDFAESFAVWLAPRSQWKQTYSGWPAIKKLNKLDELLDDLGEQRPRLRTRRTEDSLPRLRQTLGQYYEVKQGLYRNEAATPLDAQLREVFGVRTGRATAAAFLQRQRLRLGRAVSSRLGQQRYLVDQVLGQMILRSRALGLRLKGSEADALVEATLLLSQSSTRFLFGGHPRYQR